jgi:subtilisin family serine protease
MLRNKLGIARVPTASATSDEVEIVAQVTDSTAWEALSEVRLGAIIGAFENGSSIVTGRIPVNRIDYVHAQPFVKSLKASQRLSPALAKTIEETGARADLLPQGNLAAGGAGVIIGIVDSGCDFTHKNFRNSDGSTRLLAIWDQGGPTGPDSPSGYGRVYTREEIDAALQQDDPYTALGYGPPPDSVDEQGSHGTHVMDIAAGNGLGTGVPGVAPNADLIFVELNANDVPWRAQAAVAAGQTFGDSVRLLEALQYIFSFAAATPCAINISLGTNAGPHDGTKLVEQGIDRLIRQAPNRAVSIAASNSFSDGIHAVGEAPAGGQLDLLWQIPSSDVSNNELDVWYPGADRLSIEILGPNGVSLVTTAPGQNRSLTGGGKTVALIANRLADRDNGDNHIGVFLERDLPAGTWTVRFHNAGATPTKLHAWIERYDPAQSNFAPPHDNSHTLGSISCGWATIVVGSYDAHKATTPISYFSSAGPTRDGRNKPELSAPGHAVLAAWSRTGDRATRKSGTSMAAPAVTGVAALVLAEAHARGVSLSGSQLVEILTQTARQNPPAPGAWDSRYGNGRVSASAAVAHVMNLAPAPPNLSLPPVKRRTAPTKTTKTKRPAKKPGPQKKRR